MKQTSAAIIVLAASILAAGAVAGYASGNLNAGAILAVLAAPAGLIGVLALIQACLRDHDLAIDVNSRLDLLEELVFLEKLSLNRKERLKQQRFGLVGHLDGDPASTRNSERRAVN